MGSGLVCRPSECRQSLAAKGPQHCCTRSAHRKRSAHCRTRCPRECAAAARALDDVQCPDGVSALSLAHFGGFAQHAAPCSALHVNASYTRARAAQRPLCAHGQCFSCFPRPSAFLSEGSNTSPTLTAAVTAHVPVKWEALGKRVTHLQHQHELVAFAEVHLLALEIAAPASCPLLVVAARAVRVHGDVLPQQPQILRPHGLAVAEHRHDHPRLLGKWKHFTATHGRVRGRRCGQMTGSLATVHTPAPGNPNPNQRKSYFVLYTAVLSELSVHRRFYRT